MTDVLLPPSVATPAPLALSGRANLAQPCLLLAVKQICSGSSELSALDPKRSLTGWKNLARRLRCQVGLAAWRRPVGNSRYLRLRPLQ